MRALTICCLLLVAGFLLLPPCVGATQLSTDAVPEPDPRQGPMKVGEDITFAVESPHPYPGISGDEAQMVWSESIRHPGATYICPHFSRFELADGDFVVVRSADGQSSWSFRRFGKGDLGRTGEGFWANHVNGEEAIIELWSTRRDSAYGVIIDKYARGYTHEEIQRQLGGDETRALCGADDSEWAPCYELTEPEVYETSRAVARLLINGSGACTGWLIGSEGHVMTNQHCIETTNDALNTNFEFMAEGATCSTNCASWFACPGTIEAVTSTLIRNDYALDYALVELPTNISGSYGFMKLRPEGASIDERMYIPQHPAGYGKKVAVFSTHGNDQSGFAEVYSLDEPPCHGGPGDVGYFADTQGGSSGSPVLGYDDHRVIALHHCANCPNRGVPIEAVIDHLGDDLPDGAVCDPPQAPATLSATANGDNRIDLEWNEVPDAAEYHVLRSLTSGDGYSQIATVAAGTVVFSDTDVSGGTPYYYVVRSYLDCESADSPEAFAVANGLCTLPPDFAGLESVTNALSPTCGLQLTWNEGVPNCGGPLTYRVYRSDSPGFEPSAANRIAEDLSGTSFVDQSMPSSLTRYYYIVRSVDTSNAVEDTNTAEHSEVASGPWVATPIDDDFESGNQGWSFTTGAPPATTGNFVIGDPVGTTGNYGDPSQPEDDHTPGAGVNCMYTAENPGGGAGADDVDEGEVIATSPIFDATGLDMLVLDLWRWFFNEDDDDDGDYFYLEVSNDGGGSWTVLNHVPGSDISTNSWSNLVFYIQDYLPLSATMQIRFRVADGTATGDLIEAAIDDISIVGYADCTTQSGDLIFADGFESGETTSWSESMP